MKRQYGFNNASNYLALAATAGLTALGGLEARADSTNQLSLSISKNPNNTMSIKYGPTQTNKMYTLEKTTRLNGTNTTFTQLSTSQGTGTNVTKVVSGTDPNATYRVSIKQK